MNVVTLNDSVLISLANNVSARSQLPLLNAIATATSQRRGGCGSCGRKQKLSGAVLAVRTAIVSSPVALQAIKKLLRADRIVTYVRGPNGMTVRKEM